MPGGHEQVAVAGAALGPSPRRLGQDPDRHPPARQLGERVAVLDHVLAADDQLARLRRALGGEDAALDQLGRFVAGQQQGLRVERVPAGRVAVDDPAQPRRQLGEVLVAGQSPGAQHRDLLLKPLH